ncbi:MAG: hypothetical protein AVDCRST_MAG67-3148 [uncultured Solirubrobacteraceae bacterium]|uniref:Uncharacterized protein n=1 Tax=uncultured Solirubrobacteraceae bacterium TaxID=1162706 RepID=A0A6J4T9F5_9ACTN|nr:MAG: hypothetical protein AVDCRST_MAG67-3148 [uncultured Solirubrobacteraceae bacterium]
MGSFSEVVMSLDFRVDTPAEVLAAFSALEQPIPGDAWWGPAPALPEPVIEPVQWWSPDWREAGETDEFEAEPWRHDWASWLSGSMSGSTVASAALVWTLSKRWNLTCRCSFKSWAEAIFVFLEWLGPFIDSWEDRPRLVGYIDDEQEPRPYLLWVQHRRLVMEDLNPGGG